MSEVYVHNSGRQKEIDSEIIYLEFGLFFDGTLNNKNNTELRLKVLNKVEDEKTTNDYAKMLNEAKINGNEDEINEKTKYMILPNDSEQDVKKKEEAIKNERKRLHKLENINKEEGDYQVADKRSFFDKMGVDNSLMNDYTNVARMWKCCEEVYCIYIEGIGTLDKKKDVDAGFQYGSGRTGIRAKVRKGCEKLAEKVFKEKDRNYKNKIKSIELTIDVFGFSRGAAAARNFIYEINYANKREEDTMIEQKAKKIGKKTIQKIDLCGNILYETVDEYAFSYYDKEKNLLNEDLLIEGKMPRLGYLGYYLLEKGFSKEELDIIKLNIRFIGIYDTVSSHEEVGDLNWYKMAYHAIKHTALDYFDNDVEQLQLNSLGNFQKIVHFTAMNEHRKNFALTKLPFNNEKYIEKTFPGVHCDIGGAYEIGTEYVDEIDTSNHSNLCNLKKELIADHWFKEKELEIGLDWHNVAFGVLLGQLTYSLLGGATIYRKLSGTRFLRKEYSYIPLHFMEEFFDITLKEDTNNRINIIKKAIISEYSIENYLEEDQRDTLNKAKERLRTYVFRDEKKAEEDRSEEEKEWTFISDEEIKKKFREEGRKVIEEMKRENEQGKGSIISNNTQKINPLTVFDEVKKRNSIFETQNILKKLRNKYLHWSANRDWFGMQPAPGRKRDTY